MFLLRSEAESSADFQSAVSQDCILQTDQNCRSTQVSSDAVQITTLRYSPADARRRGTLRVRATLDHGSSGTTQISKNDRAQDVTKPFGMQLKRDEANAGRKDLLNEQTEKLRTEK